MPDDINLDDMTDDIEPGCSFGYVIADQVKRTHSMVTDLHEELHVNGYVDDIEQLRRYIDKKEEEHEKVMKFKQEVKIAIISAIAGGLITPILAKIFNLL